MRMSDRITSTGDSASASSKACAVAGLDHHLQLRESRQQGAQAVPHQGLVVGQRQAQPACSCRHRQPGLQRARRRRRCVAPAGRRRWPRGVRACRDRPLPATAPRCHGRRRGCPVAAASAVATQDDPQVVRRARASPHWSALPAPRAARPRPARRRPPGRRRPVSSMQRADAGTGAASACDRFAQVQAVVAGASAAPRRGCRPAVRRPAGRTRRRAGQRSQRGSRASAARLSFSAVSLCPTTSCSSRDSRRRSESRADFGQQRARGQQVGVGGRQVVAGTLGAHRDTRRSASRTTGSSVHRRNRPGADACQVKRKIR